jgi:hypothetical protein
MRKYSTLKEFMDDSLNIQLKKFILDYKLENDITSDCFSKSIQMANSGCKTIVFEKGDDLKELFDSANKNFPEKCLENKDFLTTLSIKFFKLFIFVIFTISSTGCVLSIILPNEVEAPFLRNIIRERNFK